MRDASKLNRKLLLCLQKRYIYFKFKPNDVFLQSVLYFYFCLYFVEHKNLKGKLKRGFHCTRNFVSPYFSQQIWTLNNVRCYKTWLHLDHTLQSNLDIQSKLHAYIPGMLVKFTLEQAVKAQRGSRGIVQLFL
jgi:hypothetical protein